MEKVPSVAGKVTSFKEEQEKNAELSIAVSE
jgi:hypothetical protein